MPSSESRWVEANDNRARQSEFGTRGMQVAIVTHGTRGDIQPFMTLALGLMKAGHRVLLAASSGFETSIDALAIPRITLPGDINAFLNSEEILERGRRGDEIGWRRELARFWFGVRDELWEALGQIFRSSDFVLCNGHNLFKDCLSFTERFGTKIMPVCFAPGFPSSAEFANFYITTRTLPFKFMNRWAHAYYDTFYWQIYGPYVNDLRARLGLRKLDCPIYRRMHDFDVLHCYSRYLFRRPRDWSERQKVVGPVFLSAVGVQQQSEAPSKEFRDWLQSGSAPALLAIGTQVLPRSISGAIVGMLPQLVRETGMRFVVNTGWSGIEASGPSGQSYFIKHVDHEWVLPHCRVVLHHGGMSTTAVSAMSGVPQVVCSLYGDQPFWGRQIQRLGVGFHCRAQELNATRLIEMMRLAQGESIIRRCRALAESMRSEHGYLSAMAEIERALDAVRE